MGCRPEGPTTNKITDHSRNLILYQKVTVKMIENTKKDIPMPTHQPSINRLNLSHGGYVMQTTALEKANRTNKAKRDAGVSVPREYNLIKKANANPNSLKKAIAANCFHCYGGTMDEMPDPGWQDFIRTCTAPDCPLFPHRSYIKKVLATEITSEVSMLTKKVAPIQLRLPMLGD